jgi:hypothetical protein
MDLDRLAAQMQALLSDCAEPLAWDSGCCRRHSPLAGAVLLQVLVLGCLAHPEPSLEDFAQTAGLLGHPVTAQAIAERFGPALADALQGLVAAAVRRVVARRPAAVALLDKFAAVQVQDSTTVTLPDALADYWRGGQTATGQGGQSAVKVQVRLDLRSGQLTGLHLEHGRANDHATPLQTAAVQPGELHLRDLGYFDLDVLADLAGAGAFFLSRLQDSTAVFDEAGTRLDLADYLGGQPGHTVDVPVRLGVQHRLAGRLVAVRLPEEVANRRRQALYAKGRKKGYTPSAAKLALCAWNYYVTNVPAARLTVDEVLALARARWQVECLFQQWKSDGGLARVRSGQPWRVLGEVLAKLAALVLQHAILVACCWRRANRSLRRAAKAVRRQAGQLAAGLGVRGRLRQALQAIADSLAKTARVDSRRKHPSAFQVQDDPKGCGYKRLSLT